MSGAAVRGDGVLIIGCGNPLRADDGIGWHAAARLARDPRCAGARVLTRHQLTPELAEDLGRATLAVVVDASAATGAPGAVAVHTVRPDSGRAPALSHHVDPAALVALAECLYGQAPPVYLVTVGAASFEPGGALTPAVRRALPVAVDAVAGLVAGLAGDLIRERDHA
jgi:hydrogenase maturation protease